jgi:hypothetical protein
VVVDKAYTFVGQFVGVTFPSGKVFVAESLKYRSV